MVLLSRLSTYFVPLIYFIVTLSWLLNHNFVYYGSLIVIIFLVLSIYSITNQTGNIKIFLFEMIYPLFIQVISLAFILFLPKSWIYIVMIIYFTLMLYFILNETFNRFHPFLTKTFELTVNLQIILIIALVFFMSVIGYSLVLYLGWQLWLVSLVIVFLMSLLLLRLQGIGNKSDYIFIDTAIILLTIEIFFILYYLPINIYFKSLIVSINLFILFTYIINKQFYNIKKQYEFKEKK